MLKHQLLEISREDAMIKRLIEYIILILLTIILFFLYDDEIVGMMLVMEIVYLPVSVIYINLCKLFVNVQMKNLQPVVEKNEKCSILFETSSKAFIPSVNIVLNIAVKNRFTGKSKKIKLRGKTNGKNKNEIYYDVEFNQFGSVIISFDSYEVLDWFGIFSLKKKVEEKENILIYPELKLVNVEVKQSTRKFITEADYYSTYESGDDPLETYQIREYREQDSIHDIHWKLSAKNDKLLVKERGKPEGCAVLIWVDFCGNSKDKKSIIESIEIATDISFSLLQEKCNNVVSWYDGQRLKTVNFKITSLENLYQMLNEILITDVHKLQEENSYALNDKLEKENYSTVIEMKSNGIIKINDSELRITKNKNKIQWKKLYFEV